MINNIILTILVIQFHFADLAKILPINAPI